MSKITAKGLLQAIERDAFKGIDLHVLASGSEDEQRESRLEQTERLLAETYNGLSAMWLSDQFWTADRELILIVDSHPFLDDATSNKSQEETGLSEADYQVMEWMVKTAYLCHQLFTHEPFATESFLGVTSQSKENTDSFVFDNKALVEWIRTTKYRRIAALVTRIVLDAECDRAVVSNQAVQDYYASECYRLQWDVQRVDECEDFINHCLNAMDEVYRHQAQGLSLGLSEEQIRVVDALWEYVPHDYLDDYVACAREFCQTAEQLLPPRPYIKSENGARKYQREAMEALKQIADRYEIDFEPYNVSSLAASYTATWLYDKYYK